MKIRASEIAIPPEDPFREDALNRKESAQVLTELVSFIDTPVVLAIDSKWGTGKSTFVKMWKQELLNQGYPCLYFNAWENDFSDDPLVSLIGEIDSGIDALKLTKGRKTKAKEKFAKAKEVGVTLVKRAIPAAIKITTAGVLNLDNVSEQVLAGLSEKIAKEQIEKYESDKSTIDGFKSRLRDFVIEITRSQGGKEVKPLIFFIDELDRCRPLYALGLLEKAKHFFNVAGIVFVLAIDKRQIGDSIRCVYGTVRDVDGYLRRFIDIDYILPEPNALEFCRTLFQRFGLATYFAERQKAAETQYDVDQFVETFAKLASTFGFSLRVQEQCFSRLSIAIQSTPLNHWLHPVFLAGLIALKARDPDLYARYVRGIATAEDVMRYLNAEGAGEFLDSAYGRALEAYFVSGQCEDVGALMSKYEEVSEDKGRTKEERERAGKIWGVLQSFVTKDAFGALKHLAKKIEIAERFYLSGE